MKRWWSMGTRRLDKHPADGAGYHDISWIPSYDIPYRRLLPKDFDNLLVAGRCHSATLAVLASQSGGGDSDGHWAGSWNAGGVVSGRE